MSTEDERRPRLPGESDLGTGEVDLASSSQQIRTPMTPGYHCSGAIVVGEVAEGDDRRDGTALSNVFDQKVVGVERLPAEAWVGTTKRHVAQRHVLPEE